MSNFNKVMNRSEKDKYNGCAYTKGQMSAKTCLTFEAKDGNININFVKGGGRDQLN